jgi:hypothetical protein
MQRNRRDLEKWDKDSKKLKLWNEKRLEIRIGGRKLQARKSER